MGRVKAWIIGLIAVIYLSGCSSLPAGVRGGQEPGTGERKEPALTRVLTQLDRSIRQTEQTPGMLLQGVGERVLIGDPGFKQVTTMGAAIQASSSPFLVVGKGEIIAESKSFPIEWAASRAAFYLRKEQGVWDEQEVRPYWSAGWEHPLSLLRQWKNILSRTPVKNKGIHMQRRGKETIIEIKWGPDEIAKSRVLLKSPTQPYVSTSDQNRGLAPVSKNRIIHLTQRFVLDAASGRLLRAEQAYEMKQGERVTIQDRRQLQVQKRNLRIKVPEGLKLD
ncbi:hypothetical protein GCM10011571_08230 [Marinithermofilum abyssi]|uniref:Uncharacterized protein n=1 Tax=Marinithermofilum abyssi TaxID=1571185 RepID=A0A8J2YBY3_9BACL|nr:hypothetical protein [Marinithermofilum abyssi]GGE09225.1 hypothetical protein GCM10011571_08230 [Marinithermofilum abyssi]